MSCSNTLLKPVQPGLPEGYNPAPPTDSSKAKQGQARLSTAHFGLVISSSLGTLSVLGFLHSTTFYPKPNLAKNRELLKSKTKQKLNQFLFILRVWLRPVSQEEPPWTPAAGLLAVQVALCCLLPPTVSQASRRQRLCFSLFYLEACGPRI